MLKRIIAPLVPGNTTCRHLVSYQQHQHRPISSWLGRRLAWLEQQRDGGSQPLGPLYPVCPQTIHLGDACTLVDKFSFLSNCERAKPYLHQEQLHYQQAVRGWAGLAKQLAGELRQHAAAVQVDDPPERYGAYLYGSQHNPRGEDTIWRSPAADPGRRQVLVSEQSVARDAAQVQRLAGISIRDPIVAALKVSPDHRLLAYSLRSASDDNQRHCCIIKELDTGRLLADAVLPDVHSFEWSAYGSCLYYTTPDNAGRPSQVFRRVLGDSRSADVLVFDDADPRHFITLTSTKDGAFVLINTHSKLSSEVHLLDAHDPTARPVCVHPRTPGLEFFAEHVSGHLLLLANRTTMPQTGHAEPNAPAAANAFDPSGTSSSATSSSGTSTEDYSLFTVPVAAIRQRGPAATWQLLLAASPATTVIDMEVFEGVAVLHELQEGRPCLRLLHLSCGTSLAATRQHQVHLPDWALWLRPGSNLDYRSSSFRLYASSPAQPEVALDASLTTGNLQPAPPHHHGGADPAKLADGQPHPQLQRARPRAPPPQQPVTQQGLSCSREWAPSTGGVAVPITLLQREGLPRNGSRPLLVEVYGAYGHLLEASFKPHRLLLLQRGWSVALAHVRGGGELGRRWHAGGRQLQKRNSVLDLLSCLDHLVALGVTRPGLVAGHAASAGGLTLAAAINARPEWFAAAVLEAPFVDLVAGTGAVTDAGHSLDGSGLLMQHEADEWGDPWRLPGAGAAIARLCPYTNLRAGARYPAMLLTAGLQDALVPFWMPLKYVAKLRAQAACGQDGAPPRPVLLDCAEEAGHFSRGGPGCVLEDVAQQQAFLLHHMPEASN